MSAKNQKSVFSLESNKVLSAEEEALVTFNEQWLYIVIAVAVLGGALEYFDIPLSDQILIGACYLLLVGPLLRNVVRVYFHMKEKNYRMVLLLILPIAVFSLLIFRYSFS
jgi:hypothetical protein